MEFLDGKIDYSVWPDKLFKIIVKISLLQVSDFKYFLPFFLGGGNKCGIDFISLWFLPCQPSKAWMKLIVTHTGDEEQWLVVELIPGLERSLGGQSGNPFCPVFLLDNLVDRGAWLSCSSWGCKDMTDHAHTLTCSPLICIVKRCCLN